MTALPVPVHDLTIADGGLGIPAATADGVAVLIGSSSSGTAGLYVYAGTDVQRVTTELGDRGPLPGQVQKQLIKSGGKKTFALKVTPSTAGSSSAVTQSGAGPLPTLTLTPNDYYQNQLEILDGGAVATSTFRYSMDGGDSWSQEYATAATFLLPSGVTVNFTAGTYVAGEIYSWTDTAPTFTTGDVGTALDTIIASSYDVEFVHILGQAANASDAATMFATLATKFDAAIAAHKYFWIMQEAPAVTPSSLASAFAALEEWGVMVCGGFEELVNEKTSEIEKRSSARVIAPRIARNPISIYAPRRVDDNDIDALGDVVAPLVPDGAVSSSGYLDSGSDPTLNDARFSTLMTHEGRSGIYICNAQHMAGPGSDFALNPYVRAILKVAKVWYQYGIKQLGKKIKKDVTTGYIATAFAEAMEFEGQQVILAAMGDDIAACRVLINREDNLSSDPTLRASLRIVMDGYALTFESEIGLADSLPAAA